MRKGIVLGSIAVLGLTGQAFAEDGFSYSFIEANYVNTSFDDDDLGFDDEATGFGLRGSLGFTDRVHGYIDYTTQELDFDFGLVSGDVDVDIWEVGVGVNWPVNPKLDLIGRAGYAKFDADVVDDSGYALQAGVRSRPVERFELEGLVHHVDFGDAGDGTALVANGRYFFTNALSGGLGVEFDDDATTWNLGVRYSFSTN